MAAELLKRMFQSDLVLETVRDNRFIKHSINDDALINGNSVELPNSGGRPTTEVNRSVFPATITERTDTAEQYLLESITSDPIRVRDAEEAVVAYNKLASVNKEAGQAIMETASDRAAYSWVQNASVGNANLIVTTGGSRPASGPSQTGNRKQVTKADILSANSIMNRQDMPLAGRHMLITPDQEADMLAIDEFVDANKYGSSNIPSGAIGRVFGITVWMRSRAVTTTGADVIKTEAAAAAATDQDAAIFWQQGAVRTAMGSPKIFINPNVAEHYGTIVSSELRFGGLNARGDGKGVVVLAEDTV